MILHFCDHHVAIVLEHLAHVVALLQFNNDSFRNFCSLHFLYHNKRWKKCNALCVVEKCHNRFHRLSPVIKIQVISNIYDPSYVHPFAVQLKKPPTSQFSRSFIPKVSRLWKQLPADVLPSFQNIQKSKSVVNRL